MSNQPQLDWERAPLFEEDGNPHDESQHQRSEHASKLIKTRLYLSHFLSTWCSRVFEFGAVIYLAEIFPDTLLPMSVYALIRGMSAIAFASPMGRFVDRAERLRAVRHSIVWPRLFVAASCVGFWILLTDYFTLSTATKSALMIFLVLSACVEKVLATMNLVCIEKDWVVIIAGDSTTTLRTLNAQMRRIDLVCKMLGPFFIATIAAYSVKLAVLVNLGMNLVSVVLEYPAIASVYRKVPELQRPKVPTAGESHEVISSRQLLNESAAESFFGDVYKDTMLYFRHSAFLPSFAGAVLYCTVLSFGGQMVTYLLTQGLDSSLVATARTAAVAFELVATWAAPALIGRIGPTRSGLWFLTSQALSLSIGAFLFRITLLAPSTATGSLVLATILSRVGLRGYDLCAQIIVQDSVEAESRGVFSSVEAGWQSVFELCSYLITIIFSRPSQFPFPVYVSCAMVWLACLLHSIYVRSKRGHLLHFNPKSWTCTLRSRTEDARRDAVL